MACRRRGLLCGDHRFILVDVFCRGVLLSWINEVGEFGDGLVECHEWGELGAWSLLGERNQLKFLDMNDFFIYSLF